jgi:hypothetical protein
VVGTKKSEKPLYLGGGTIASLTGLCMKNLTPTIVLPKPKSRKHSIGGGYSVINGIPVDKDGYVVSFRRIIG